MGDIYQKLAEKTMIPAAREGYRRQFDFGDWTEMRFGILFSGVTAAGDNTMAVTEAVTLNTADDRIAFGLKDNSAGYPGTTGTLFLGGGNTGTSSDVFVSGAAGQFYDSTGATGIQALGLAGTVLKNGTGNMASMVFPDAAAASAYCGFYALKFVLTDRGLATQSVAISAAWSASVSGTDYSPGALLTLMNNGTYGTARTVQWNDGAAAYDIPDCCYIRMPFFNNRIRVSCMRPRRYS